MSSARAASAIASEGIARSGVSANGADPRTNPKPTNSDYIKRKKINIMNSLQNISIFPRLAGLSLAGKAITLTPAPRRASRSEEHTSELQSLMRISYAVFCLKKKNNKQSDKYQQTHYRIPHRPHTTNTNNPLNTT